MSDDLNGGTRDEDLQPSGDPERYRRTLARGILVFRWIWLAWMTTLAATASEDFTIPGLAWASIGAAAGWTAWLTTTRHKWTRSALWFDLGLCFWLVVVSAIVVPDEAVVAGRPFFATGYPLSAPLFWGASRGVAGGVLAAAVLGAAHVATRPLNGVPLGELSGTEIQHTAGAVLNYVVAGVAIGIVARVLVRSAEAVEAASAKLMAERERAARLAEREKLARQIHDSVLQALAFVHKRGRELSSVEPIPAAEVARLADVAATEERELRSLILRDPEDAPTGSRSLRDALEEVARATSELPVTVSSVGPIWMASSRTDELAAAVRQGVENAVEHADARKVTLFAEVEDGEIVVSVRDDGKGFVYDEQRLRNEGKAGMLMSMKGRAEEMGGRMTVTSSPGSGTEIEFRVPAR